MTQAGVQAIRGLIADALRIFESLTPEEWPRQSACAGWRVQDVVTHMAWFFNAIADPTLAQPGNPSGKAERLNDIVVAERQGWNSAKVLEYYETQAAAALPVLDSFQSSSMAGQMVPMGDLGSYPLHALSDATTFDHVVHVAIDLLAPSGPLTRPPIVIDEGRMAPALDWMVGGIPQMCGTEVAQRLTRPVEIRLQGPGERRFVLTPTPGEPTPLEVGPATGTCDTTVTSSSIDFLSWATTRSSWRQAVRIAGDELYAAAVLDRINVV